MLYTIMCIYTNREKERDAAGISSTTPNLHCRYNIQKSLEFKWTNQDHALLVPVLGVP